LEISDYYEPQLGFTLLSFSYIDLGRTGSWPHRKRKRKKRIEKKEKNELKRNTR